MVLRPTSPNCPVAACANAFVLNQHAAVRTGIPPGHVPEFGSPTIFGRLLKNAAAVAIGRTTAHELASHGQHAVVAESATLHGLALTTLRLLQTRA